MAFITYASYELLYLGSIFKTVLFVSQPIQRRNQDSSLTKDKTLKRYGGSYFFDLYLKFFSLNLSFYFSCRIRLMLSVFPILVSLFYIVWR